MHSTIFRAFINIPHIKALNFVNSLPYFFLYFEKVQWEMGYKKKNRAIFLFLITASSSRLRGRLLTCLLDFYLQISFIFVIFQQRRKRAQQCLFILDCTRRFSDTTDKHPKNLSIFRTDPVQIGAVLAHDPAFTEDNISSIFKPFGSLTPAFQRFSINEHKK